MRKILSELLGTLSKKIKPRTLIEKGKEIIRKKILNLTNNPGVYRTTWN